MAIALKDSGFIREISPGTEVVFPDGSREQYEVVARWSEQERNAKGVFTIIPPADVLPSQRQTGTLLAWDGTRVIREQTVGTIPLVERKASMYAALAETRWHKENGGVSFAFQQVPSDDRSKLLVFAARTKAKEDANYSKRWKIAPGRYVTLAANALIALGDALETHVAACFEREAELADAIALAESHDELDAIDLHSRWPDNQ